jgi:hypothetical protein
MLGRDSRIRPSASSAVAAVSIDSATSFSERESDERMRASSSTIRRERDMEPVPKRVAAR